MVSQGGDFWALRDDLAGENTLSGVKRLERPKTSLENLVPSFAAGRGGAYSLAAAKALPEATQVADRWHLMENASRAFLDAVGKSMRQIRTSIDSATINPDLLTAAERIQYQGYLHREDTNAAIMHWPSPELQSKKSFVGPGTVAASSGGCCVGNDPTCSACRRTRLKFICPGPIIN